MQLISRAVMKGYQGYGFGSPVSLFEKESK